MNLRTEHEMERISLPLSTSPLLLFLNHVNSSSFNAVTSLPLPDLFECIVLFLYMLQQYTCASKLLIQRMSLRTAKENGGSPGSTG